jgi:hypothetical protein
VLSLVRTYRRLHQCNTERLDDLENELNRATILNLGACLSNHLFCTQAD